MAVYTLCRIQISGDPIPRSDPSQAQGTNRIDPCAVADAVSVFCCCISAAAAARRNLCRSGKITEYRCIRCRQETGRWLTNGALVIAAAADTYIRRHILRTAVETLVDTSIYTSQHVEYAARPSFIFVSARQRSILPPPQRFSSNPPISSTGLSFYLYPLLSLSPAVHPLVCFRIAHLIAKSGVQVDLDLLESSRKPPTKEKKQLDMSGIIAIDRST
ncbi:predicted protein [Histoplasma capsulatum var. duboisii H88]|uniref:Predicted protein n=1 Tax=Ajellomyces capsulatus (strain H88) TaxID=544711 RepID=F0UQZ9_AJEC8|nr:predicted protein [Histoplasma capsulatum var. duboisii H88]